MKVLVTGSNGFIGRNLLERISKIKDLEISTFTRSDDISVLEDKVNSADFIYHLAGINRPASIQEFYDCNQCLTKLIVTHALNTDKNIPILFCSSTQVGNDNDYGKSKLGGEDALAEYAKISATSVYIYRLPNVFGKWSRPNYNTVIATWCHNLSRDIPIVVNEDSTQLDLVYIDDVVEDFITHLHEVRKNELVYCEVSTLYKESISTIRDLLLEFKKSRTNLLTPSVGVGFPRALYATYLSFLPSDQFSYEIQGYKDERGAFYEFLKTHDSGQFSISTSAPGVTRGNHYHNTKNEKFLVVKGTASIKLRHILSEEVVEYIVSDKKIEVVEMIPGFTHNITNIGDNDMILLLWANEVFDRDKPDTYMETVLPLITNPA